MNTRTQGLVVAVLAVVLIRVAWTGEYLRFVAPWMQWPLVVTGVIMLAMAARPALSPDRSHAESGPRSAWLLLLPTLMVFTVPPPALGAFLAERRADETNVPAPVVVELPESDEPVPLTVGEFLWGASEKGDPMGLEGRTVTLTGFVSVDNKGNWYVTRFEIGCCAADAQVYRVRVAGVDAPPRDQWVEVTGSWAAGTGRSAGDPATIEPDRIVEIEEPDEVYG